MSKEIYKEYVNGRIDGLEDDSQYLYEGKQLHKHRDFNQSERFLFVPDIYHNLFTRKPKTQMINGHEVVAPRYDMPEHRTDIFIMNCYYESGIERINFSVKTMKSIAIWGWFDNEKDAIAYANARRENKNE